MPSTGYVADSTDCDDTDAAINPGGTDIPDDGIDQDCDGTDATALTDTDGDGYTSDVDCDDTDATINPAATDVCAAVDTDCDGDIDSTATDMTTWYIDGDGDSYGSSVRTADSCTQPSGYADNDADCDDRDAAINPAATDIPGDGIDQDCDGTDATAGTDLDGDGFDSIADGGTDCDDGDASIYVGATEICGDGIDQDCDGADEACSSATAVADLVAGDLVISEFHANPAVVADSAGEWFEVYNASGAEVDLDGLVVYDLGSDSFTVSGTLLVAAADYVVFGINDDTATNDGVTVDYAYSGMNLSNSSDELVLNNGTIDLDDIIWDGTWGVSSGYALQLDPTALDATSNDDPANWCAAASMYGASNYGTPGAANAVCAVPTDADGDGYDDTAFGGADCDDSDDTINPGATEICGDGIDQDCDGADAACVTIDWCNVQYVSTSTLATGDSIDVYGQVYAAGVTDVGSPGAGITGQLGYGGTGANPEVDPSAFTWVDSSFNTDYFANDEYAVTETMAEPGYFGVAFRFSGDAGVTWSYCDAGGTDHSTGDVYDVSSEWLITVGTDADGDSWFALASGGDDCDDTDATINPAASDLTVDGVDQDCDGTDGPGSTTFAITDLLAGDLVITEYIANPAAVSDGSGEWFEVYNAAGGDVDLEGLVLYDLGSDSHTVVGSLVVADGDYVVFGNNDDSSTNGGVTVDYDYGGSWYLSNSSDEIVLNNGTIDIDDVIYDSAFPGGSGFAAQLDSASVDATSNDDAGNWCDATDAYGDGDLGTPGDANNACAPTYTYTHNTDIQPLWDANCASCHIGGGSSAGLALDSGYSATVGVVSSQVPALNLVEAGDTSTSYLWQKINGTASVGGQMPLGGGSMSAADLAMIETWITEGAPE